MNEPNGQNEYWRQWRRFRNGCKSIPFLSLYRDVESFGVVELIDDPDCNDLMVVRWLVRGVTESEARAVLEHETI